MCCTDETVGGRQRERGVALRKGQTQSVCKAYCAPERLSRSSSDSHQCHDGAQRGVRDSSPGAPVRHDSNCFVGGPDCSHKAGITRPVLCKVVAKDIASQPKSKIGTEAWRMPSLVKGAWLPGYLKGTQIPSSRKGWVSQVMESGIGRTSKVLTYFGIIIQLLGFPLGLSVTVSICTPYRGIFPVRIVQLVHSGLRSSPLVSILPILCFT
nr:hypothetical protein CFP56_02575 [Quercus suber]